MVFIAGRTGLQLGRLFAAVDEVAAAFRRRVATGPLNRAVEGLTARQPPPRVRGRAVRVYYATQVSAAPPRFVLFANRPEGLTGPYLRYLENGLREAFDFTGTPIEIKVRQREQGAGRGRGGGGKGKTP
jgi:GTP-binding protein